MALVCSGSKLWHLELETVPHKPENKSWHSRRRCLTLQGEVITSHEDRWNEDVLWAFCFLSFFLCCNNSESSTGPAVQNAGHWSRMPHLCGGSPQPPVHPRVVRSGRGRRGEETSPAAECFHVRTEALTGLIYAFLVMWSHLPRYQTSSWKRGSTVSSSGKVGCAASYRTLLEVHVIYAPVGISVMDKAHPVTQNVNAYHVNKGSF